MFTCVASYAQSEKNKITNDKYEWKEKKEYYVNGQLKVILKSKKKKSKSCELVDGKCDWIYIKTEYYENGNVKSLEKAKGWTSGWGDKKNTVIISYDESGKKIGRKRLKYVNGELVK